MLISIIIPLLNEEENLSELYHRLVAVCDKLQCDRQIIFVDDGSTDGSPRLIQNLAASDDSVLGIRLSRNFGHEAASTAGLDAACGDVTVLMDADLQDPPEIIERMVDRWKQGNQIVSTTRRGRQGESILKKATAWAFYRILSYLSDVPIPLDSGDFRLVDAKVLHAIRECREQDRFVRGLMAWTGFRTTTIEYDRPARFAGRTHYGFWKLLLLSLDAVVGFSIAPLRIASAAGLLLTIFSLSMASIIIAQKVLAGIPIPPYTLLTSSLFFFGGIQMLFMGILGEYIGRIYRQTQARPLYLVAETIGSSHQLDITTADGQTHPRFPTRAEWAASTSLRCA